RHGEYHNISVKDFLQVIIDNHNRDIANDDIDKMFRIGKVEVDSSTSELYRYLGYKSTFDTIKDKLFDRLGGELHVRKENDARYLDYLMPSNTVKQTEIRLAKNLKSITKEVDATEIITRLVPLGERIESEDEEATDASEARLTIESVNNGRDYVVDTAAEQAIGTVIVKSESWDDITQPNILKTRGEQHLKENNRVKSQYQISALDLSLIGLDTDSFDVGYYYPVINPVMQINENLRVIGKTMDVINPNQNILTFGDKFKTASEYQSESNKVGRNVVTLQNRVDSQIRTIGTLKNEVRTVETNVGEIQQIINSGNLDQLNKAVVDLQESIESLGDAMEDIPTYELATPTTDGLIPASDKAKLDLITVLSSINLDELKHKLDLINIVNPVNLDDLSERVEALEGGGGNGDTTED